MCHFSPILQIRKLENEQVKFCIQKSHCYEETEIRFKLKSVSFQVPLTLLLHSQPLPWDHHSLVHSPLLWLVLHQPRMTTSEARRPPTWGQRWSFYQPQQILHASQESPTCITRPRRLLSGCWIPRKISSSSTPKKPLHLDSDHPPKFIPFRVSVHSSIYSLLSVSDT